MKKIKFFPILARLLVLCLLVGCLAPAALALEEPDIRASNVMLIEAITGQVLYEKDATRPSIPPAPPRSSPLWWPFGPLLPGRSIWRIWSPSPRR